MSFLPIILTIVFLLNKNANFKDVLSGFDVESIAPLLSLFGVPESAAQTLKSEEFKNVLNGSLDVKTILPLITNLISSFKTASTANTSENPLITPEYLNPIKDVASPEILSSLGSYFN